MPNSLKSSVPCLYADDTQIFTSSHDPTEIANNLNSDLEIVTDWLNVNKLRSHPTKSKTMVIGSRNNLKSNVDDFAQILKLITMMCPQFYPKSAWGLTLTRD